MSPEQIAELKPRDRLMSRLLRKAEFVRLTAHGVVIRWEGEREEGELYGLSDPILKSLTFHGRWDLGERPWFDSKIKPIRSRPKKKPPRFRNLGGGLCPNQADGTFAATDRLFALRLFASRWLLPWLCSPL